MSSGTTTEPMRFGLIGVDSPHAPSFARLFHDGVNGTVRGGRVTAAWKGVASPDFPPSRDRIDSFAAEMAELDVPLCASPQEVAAECDGFLVVSADTRTHPGYFTQLAPYGKPVYVDTRFALSTAEADGMLAAAETHGCLVLAGSPKRFTPEFRAARAGGRVDRIDLTGALPTQPEHPFLAWYGVHLVDLAVAALGPGCVSVDAVGTGRVTLHWEDGRRATLGGEEQWSPLTTGRLDGPGGEREFTIEAGPAMLTGLLSSLVESCRTGRPNVPTAEVREIVAIVEAADRSRRQGVPVTPGRGSSDGSPQS